MALAWWLLNLASAPKRRVVDESPRGGGRLGASDASDGTQYREPADV